MIKRIALILTLLITVQAAGFGLPVYADGDSPGSGEGEVQNEEPGGELPDDDTGEGGEEVPPGTGEETQDPGGETQTPDEDAFAKTLATFPESYRDQLTAIHKQYPNWVFVADNNKLDWQASVDAECKLGTSLVTSKAISSWKSIQSGAYNWSSGSWVGMDGGSWNQASPQIVAYFMDPRTYMASPDSLFAFLDYTYSPDTQTKEGLKNVVSGTFLDGSFTEGGKTYKYVDVIMEVAKSTKMNPYVIATTIRTEIGNKGTSDSISGKVSGYEGYYNYYNIGAFASGDMGPITRGLWYAAGEGSGKTSYGRPWNTRYKAIKGGAMFLVSDYVSVGQNTLYYKKFNVSPTTTRPYKHQYMTNIQSVNTQSKILANAYNETTRKEALVFKIPVFDNMPSDPVTKPAGDGSPDYRLKALSVKNYSIKPSFSTDTLEYNLVVAWDTESIAVTATPKNSNAKVSGAGTLKLGENGNSFKIVVTAQNGLTRTYTLNVAKEAAPVLPVQGDLNIGEDNIITGITAYPIAAADLLSHYVPQEGNTAGMVDASGSVLEGLAGTGCRIEEKDPAGTTVKSYTVLIYGDVNGDGRVSTSDLLKLQKHILAIEILNGVSLAAGDANRNGSVSTSDLLSIQKSILGLSTLAQ